MKQLLFVFSLIVPSVTFAQSDEQIEYLRATITQVTPVVAEQGSEQNITAQVITTNESIEFTYLPNPLSPELEVGKPYVLQQITQYDGSVITLVREPWRLPALAWAFVAFLLIAIVCSGKKAIGSIAGLLSSILVLALIVLPAIVYGLNALLACIIGCILIAVVSVFSAHGYNKRTKIAFVSIVGTTILALILGAIGVHIANLHGLGSEESRFIVTGGLEYINMRGVLLGGMLLGALGVLDDITTAQAAAIDEISRANASLSANQLWQAGRSIGNEHIASLINTLALAYFGASLPLLLLLFTDSSSPWWVTLNTEFLAEEIIRTITGSIALVLAVPITTYIAAKQFAYGNCSGVSGGHSHSH